MLRHKVSLKVIGLFSVFGLIAVVLSIVKIGATGSTNTFSGTFRDNLGNPLANVQIQLASSSGNNAFGTTDSSGHFSLPATIDHYRISVQINPGTDGISGYITMGSNDAPIDLTAGDLNEDLQVNLVHLTVTVKNSSGNPVPNMPILSDIESGSTSIITGGPSDMYFHNPTNANLRSNGSGVASLTLISGVKYGQTSGLSSSSDNLCEGNAPNACLSAPLTVTSDTSIDLVEPVTHTFSGTFHDNLGNPLSNVEINLTGAPGHNASGNTDSNGHFSLLAVPDRYKMQLQINPGTDSLSGYTTLNSTDAPIDLSTADVSKDLQVNTAKLVVTAKDSAGNALTSLQINVNPDTPGGSIAVISGGPSDMVFTDPTNSNIKTNSTGVATFQVVQGLVFSQTQGQFNPSDNICEAATPNTCMAQPLTVSGDTNVELDAPALHIFSGTFRDNSGNPLANARIYLNGSNGHQVAGTTDANGNFSESASPDKYNFDITVNPGTDGMSGYTEVQSFDDPLDLTTGDVTQNLQLNIAHLSVTTLDSSGNPVPNMGVSAYPGLYPSGGTTSIIPGGPNDLHFAGNTLYSGKTNSSGVAAMIVAQGVTFNQSQGRLVTSDNICEQAAPDLCIPRAVTVGGDTSVIIMPAPVAPTGLAATSPTNSAPSLSWNPVSGATSYNIYRNNTLLDTINSNTNPVTYTDFLAAEGTISYFVTAVNAGGESGHSNSISVVYDHTAPTISYVVSPAPNGAGWNNATTTVTYSCTDNAGGSGVATYSQPQTESVDGTYALVGFCTDNAGITSSVNVTINIDETPPVVSNLSVNPSSITVGSSTALSATVSDATSGVAAAEYFVGTNPGQGNGATLTISNGSVSATVSNLPAGIRTISVRAKDNAGNWSSPQSVTVMVQLAAPTGLTAQSPTNHAPALTWNSVTGADHYDVYRDGSKVGSSTTASYNDLTATDGSHGYYVKAVTADGVSSAASNTATVLLDTVAPTISYTISPTPNSNGWNNGSVTVTFTCTDNSGGSGIASCNPASTVISSEGANQSVVGTATDNAGNTATATATVNIDKTAPTVGMPSWTNNPMATNQTATVSVPASDTLSGVARGEFYFGTTDPGQGNGTAMTYSGGNLTGSFSNLTPNVYTVNFRALDKAGNWSGITTDYLVVYNSANSTADGHHNSILPVFGTDALPGLMQSGQTDKAMTAFSVKITNGQVDSASKVHFAYSTGTNCGKPTASNCHSTTLDATSIAWMVINGTNNSVATIQGTATVTIDGTTTANPFKVVATDGGLLNPQTNDQFQILIYAPGANPNTDTPLYHLNEPLTKGSIVVKG